MSERRRSIARIVALQDKVAAAAAARLAQAEARKAEIAAARTALEVFVETADLTGPMALLAIGSARRLSADEAAAEARRVPLAHARLAAETRLKLATRVGDAITRDEILAAERRALERLIEETLARDETNDGSRDA